MLEELHIRGLGVIDDAVLPFDPGLTAVTGETGAGKTMVVTGLQLLFGGRADSARVRAGAEHASIDGRLDIAQTRPDGTVTSRIRDAGGELDDGTGLVLRRVVSAAGRSRAHAGGAPVPVAVLGNLAEELLVVHGQADQQRLAHAAQQRAALDRFASLDVGDYTAAYAAWREAAAVLRDRTSRLAELRREADLLEHGIAEIDAVEPQPGEDAELTALASRLAHADALGAAARSAHDLLLGNADSAIDDSPDVAGLLGIASRSLGQQAGADPQLDQLAARLVDLAETAADLGADLGSYADQLDADPERLEQVESRRAQLIGLIRKYGADAEKTTESDLGNVLQWRKQATERLLELDVSDEALAALARTRDVARERVEALASEISVRRQAAAARLSGAVTSELVGLAMPTARIDVMVRPRDGGPGPDGADEVEFLFQAHPSAPELPLAKSASGGELSRVMLAVELCLAGVDPVPTMVFDEVDAGVGGRAALEVGRRLARLARSCQVIVVTHLAQVAAFADRQIVVDKAGNASGAAVTASDVRVVEGDDRVAELARMLAGSDSATALEHAAELLATAASERTKLLKK